VTVFDLAFLVGLTGFVTGVVVVVGLAWELWRTWR